MPTHDINSLATQLAAMQATLVHMEDMMKEGADDRKITLSLVRDVENRVTRLEERMVPRAVVEANTLNAIGVEVRDEERRRSVERSRKNILLMIAIASGVGSMVAVIVQFILATRGV